MDEREVFVRIMQQHGRPAPVQRRLDIQPPLQKGETDCWTYAYNYAVAHPGARYVEGICFTDNTDGKITVHAHAWVEEDTPFGAVLVEFTPGYEAARDYRGIALRLDSPEVARAADGDTRYSAIELDIAIRSL
jgi:hypothetical protein